MKEEKNLLKECYVDELGNSNFIQSIYNKKKMVVKMKKNEGIILFRIKKNKDYFFFEKVLKYKQRLLIKDKLNIFLIFIY